MKTMTRERNFKWPRRKRMTAMKEQYQKKKKRKKDEKNGK